MMKGGDENRQLDPQLWHACAGGMVQMPPLNSRVIYFPQGHIDHSHVSLDSSSFPSLPPLLPCLLSSISYLADPDSDEVFARIRLLPLPPADFHFSDDPAAAAAEPPLEAPASFAKTLTQSDANNGGGFSVPRYCAETIFPPLDYSAVPPVQTILAKDVHGVTWKFRHIYRGTPRRHLLTSGWSNFVSHKKLLAGDSIVFLRSDSGDLCVGIRRAKKGIGGGPESPPTPTPSGGYASFLNLRDDESRMRGGFGRSWNGGGLALGPAGKVGVESVIEAARLAASGRPFEVVYYPRSSTPEFCVRASAVRAALQVQWCSGMRFKMAFETGDSSRISWFMGTISAVQVADPVHWPNSPWRLLQVEWDEPELLQNVKRVNPWLVEMVASMPAIHHMSPFSPPRKKLRLPQPQDLPFIDGLPVPPLFSNTLKPRSTFCCVSDKSVPAGIEGARHALFGHPPSFASFGKVHSGLFPAFLIHPDFGTPIQRPAFTGHSFVMSKPKKVNDHDLSCLLTMGSHYDSSKKRDDFSVAPKFMLFGKPILTAEQISQSLSGDFSSNSTPSKSVQKSSDSSRMGPTVSSTDDRAGDQQSKTELGLLQAGHCKLFIETGAGDQQSKTELANMFGIERPEIMLNNVNHKPFSEFLKTARTLTVLADAGGENLAR